MVDAVLLEFDGVIADTRGARRSALLDALQGEGVQLDEREYFECCASMPVRAAVRAAFATRNVAADETAIELAALRTERNFNAYLGHGISLADGIHSLIDALHAQTRLAIVSSAARSEIDGVLSMARLDHAFEFVITGDDAYEPKPSPAAYAGALERLARRRSVTARNVVALEAGAVGIRSAKAAGIRCAAVGPLPLYLAVDADALVPSLSGVTLASLDTLTRGKRAAER